MTSIHALEDAAAQARWLDLWHASPQRSPFSSLAYARAAAAAFDVQCEMLLVRDDEQDEAGALLFWKRRGPYRLVTIPPYTPYTPLVVRNAVRDAEVTARSSVLEPLLDNLERRFHALQLFCNALPDTRPALWRGWDATPFYTYHLALQSDEKAIIRSWSKGRRYCFQKDRTSFTVAEAPHAAPLLVELVTQSYQRHERHLPTKQAHLTYLLDMLLGNGMVRIFTATPQGARTPTACLAVAHDGQTAGYWLGGSLPGPAMTVLLGETILRFRAEGFLQFDFLGANTPSIAQFKRQFGASMATYYLLEKTLRPELRLLKLVYDRR